MVFAHGFGCDQGMWRHVAPAFARHPPGRPLRPRRCRRLGPLGVPAVPATAASRATPTDVTEILDALDLPPVVFVGPLGQRHDRRAGRRRPAGAVRPAGPRRAPARGTSTTTATAAASRQAEIDELLETMDGNYLGWSRHIAPVIMGVPERPELGEELASSFCRTDPAIARRFARTTFLSDNRADLDRVRTPVPRRCSAATTSIAPMEVGRVRARAPAGQRVGRARRDGPLPEPQRARTSWSTAMQALPRRGARPPCRTIAWDDAPCGLLTLDRGRHGARRQRAPCWPGWAATRARRRGRAAAAGPPRGRWPHLLGDAPGAAAARRAAASTRSRSSCVTPARPAAGR